MFTSYVMIYAKVAPFTQEHQEIAALAKSLSHPARIAILSYLAKEGRCVSGDITAVIPLARSTASQHLQALKEAGLIQGTIEGPHVSYCLSNDFHERLAVLIPLMKLLPKQNTCC